MCVYCNQQEYRELWHRLRMFTSMDSKLESRLVAKNEGILLPQGNDEKYVRRLKREKNSKEHAQMMVSLQRTQQLGVNEWREIREEALSDPFGQARSADAQAEKCIEEGPDD